MPLRVSSFIALALGCVPSLFGQTSLLEGKLRSTGSEGNTVPTIQTSDDRSVDVCSGPLARRLGKLSGMKVRVSGTLRSGKSICFEATDFTVSDTGSGRDALVGVLGEESGNYYVQKDDGSRRALDRVPSGLRKLTGKKVIIDVKPIDGMKETNSKSLRVVTYSEFP